MSKTNLKLVIALARAHRELFDKIDHHIRSYGINSSQFGVLEMLYHKGAQPVQKIAEKVLVTSGTITYHIRALEKHGYVVRTQSDQDRRVFYIDLTDRGREMIASVFPEHEEFLAKELDALDEPIKEQLVNLLFGMYDTLLGEKESPRDAA